MGSHVDSLLESGGRRSPLGRQEAHAILRPWSGRVAEPEPASTGSGFRFWCYSRMLLLARVIGWINVSYREWPLTVKLNDRRTAYPTVVVHFGRGFGVSPRR